MLDADFPSFLRYLAACVPAFIVGALFGGFVVAWLHALARAMRNAAPEQPKQQPRAGRAAEVPKWN